MDLSYSSQPQEVPQIEIVVPDSDDRMDTPCPSTMPSPSLRPMASSDQIRPETPLDSSTACASSSRSHPASSGKGTTPTSGSLTQVPSSAGLKGAQSSPKPIPASEVKRNDRKRIIPKPKHKVDIGSMDVLDHPQIDGWVPNVHPDGALYFFDPKRRIYTDANLLDENERSRINSYAEQLLQMPKTDKLGSPWTACELVLELTDKGGCGYYFIEPGNRRIFWLERVRIEKLTNLRRVDSLAHIKYVMEAEYWTHCMLFPNGWSVTPEVVAELKKMVLHATADNVASTTSVIPFDKEELKQILDLIDALKDGTEELFPHANCIIARFMHDFALAKFSNFCGQPWARLNSDQSILNKSKPRRSLFTIILSLLLFWAPCDYAKELDGIWIDEVLNRVMWKRFIANLNNDWTGLALSATVILNANVAFLALNSVNTVAKSFSFVSTVASVGVVLVGLILVRQSRRQDSAEQGDKILGKMALPLIKTEMLAILFSLPYALLLWSMVWFIIAFACMAFSSTHLATQSIFGVALGFMAAVVAGATLTTRL